MLPQVSDRDLYMVDVENPNPNNDCVHDGKAAAGEGIESLGLCAGALVIWTIIFAVGLVVFFCPAVHASRAVRLLASVGLSVAIMGFAAGIGWCARVIWPAGNVGGLGQ